MSSRPTPCAPARRVHVLDELQRRQLLTVEGDRYAAVEGDDHLVGLARDARVLRVGVHVLDRRVPDVLEEPGLDGPAPQVLVDRVRRLLVLVDGQVVPLGPLDGLVSGHGVVADRRDARHVRCERADAHLEAHLVVALAGAAMRHGRRTVLARGVDQVLDDERPGQGGHQRVAVHVERVGRERRQAVLIGELIARVRDLRLDGATGDRPLTDDLEILTVLPDVHRDRDHLGAGCLGDPADGHGRVEAS